MLHNVITKNGSTYCDKRNNPDVLTSIAAITPGTAIIRTENR